MVETNPIVVRQPGHVAVVDDFCNLDMYYTSLMRVRNVCLFRTENLPRWMRPTDRKVFA